MSYIRCLSSPEGLYVYGDENGNVSWNCQILIPEEEFKAFLKEFGAGYGKLGDIEIRQLESRRKVKNPFPELGSDKITIASYKDALYYKGELISKMWRVTWVYIARNMMKTFGIK